MLATELDDELLFYSDAYVTRSVHDSTPSLSGELLRSIDAVIRDVDVDDDDEDEDKQRGVMRFVGQHDETKV